MIIIISLVNTSIPLNNYHLVLCWKHLQSAISTTFECVTHSIVNYSHHAEHEIPKTYHLITGSLHLLTNISSFPPPPHPLSAIVFSCIDSCSNWCFWGRWAIEISMLPFCWCPQCTPELYSLILWLGFLIYIHKWD